MRKIIEFGLTVIVFLIFILMLKHGVIFKDTAVLLSGFLVFIGIQDIIKELIKWYSLLDDNTKGKSDEIRK